MNSAFTILVVDDDAVSRHVLTQTLSDAGLSSITLSSGQAAIEWLELHTPTVLLLDLVMADPDGYAVLAHVRAQPRLKELPVVVLTALESDEEIERVFSSGADDYVHKPFRPAELVARIRSQTRMREYVERLSLREHDQEIVLELTQKLASTFDVRDILFAVVQRLAGIARVDRCSIVLFGESGQVGYVLATSDDARLRDLPIDLAKYPELREVLATGKNLVIRDAAQHPLLEVVRQDEAARGFNSLALVPIVHDHGPLGVLFLRARAKVEFGDHELSLVSTIANATAIALRNARILSSLRAETAQSTVARVEAERRVQLFQRYADFFESAADGMVVIDRDGKVLLANPRAREITGSSESELLGLPIERLLDPSEQARVQRLLRGFADGVYPRGVDFLVRRRAGRQLTVNVSSSSVLHEDNAVLFTLRDVTQERRTAIELKQTKEFLECVIDSSVDGIVSADLRGTVLLFNRAASRIFGYPPEEVIGKLRVDKLYPPGVAREVMQRILDPNESGFGRLQDYRVDMLGSDGRPIQVQLSASLVVDNGHKIGSVGIFTDIRDKLRIQAELERAQDELRNHEKQAIVAELAGAAAHELNQPLTSVIGYAELLRRQLSESPQHLAALQIIADEAERMAEIVRKVGRITKYETKSYVGGAKILDLEKASGNDPSSEESPGS
ncbi:MAG TPA: PAS domain S-box protein [Polyangiaceae bacterium]|nr:PAS domain S-box protein [Polyangiaceae bacterium]